MAKPTQPNDVPIEIIYDALPTISAITDMGRTAVYNAIREHGFPEPYQLGARVSRWKRTEVLQWLENRPRGTVISNAQKFKKTTQGATA